MMAMDERMVIDQKMAISQRMAIVRTKEMLAAQFDQNAIPVSLLILMIPLPVLLRITA